MTGGLLTDRGSTRAWRRLRLEVLTRDGFECHWCGGYAEHADHLIPRSRGGPDVAANLVAACAACNLRRGDGRHVGPPPPSRPW